MGKVKSGKARGIGLVRAMNRLVVINGLRKIIRLSRVILRAGPCYKAIKGVFVCVVLHGLM